mmetsp:Transcript_82715/g.162246  ORF Transcript_82715/g.162246 Transcript_82715/m.162246 type:complete len:256 (+) Transcript_82715:248-1015(+)
MTRATGNFNWSRTKFRRMRPVLPSSSGSGNDIWPTFRTTLEAYRRLTVSFREELLAATVCADTVDEPSPRQAAQVLEKPRSAAPSTADALRPAPAELGAARMRGTARTWGQRSVYAFPFSFETSSSSMTSARRAKNAARMLQTSPCWQTMPALRLTSQRSEGNVPGAAGGDSDTAAGVAEPVAGADEEDEASAAEVPAPPEPFGSSVSTSAAPSSTGINSSPGCRPPHRACCTSARKALKARTSHGDSCCAFAAA